MKNINVLRVLLLFSFVTVLSAEPVKSVISVAPYLQNPVDNGITVMWETSQPCYSWVEYGLTDKLGSKAETIIDGMRQANNTRNCVRIDNLKPATKYFYRVCGRTITKFGAYKVTFEDQYSSEIFSFTTLDPDAENTTCVIFSDLHDNLPMFEKLSQSIAGINYDFTMMNGDIFNDPHLESEVTKSIKTFNGAVKASTHPVFYIRGNHEYRGPYARLIKNHFDLPNDSYYYAFTHAGVRFIFLDCGEDKEDSHWAYSGLNDFSGYRKKQLEWLKKETQSDEFKSANFRVLVHHIPLYTHKKAVWAFSRESKALWGDFLNGVGIDAAICGHLHHAQIIKKNELGNNYPVIISGGKTDESAAGIKLEANSEQLKLQIFDIANKPLLDPLVLNKK